ncbi:MAG TPA: nucleoside hydrolase-like domain-containing protein [Micromonosporaceae bacterium]|nr:nucleoside hydrolase-like domain-containing protein [Micromonosporaceae bacterium]
MTFSSNNRHFVDANNQPFYFAADTGWFMLQSATEEEWDLYLDNRRAKGFTAVMVMAPQMFNEKNRYGELPFTTPGHLSTLNERWWARMDTFVGKAAARGMAVNMALLWLGYKNEGWGVAYGYNTVAQSRTFGQVMGRRYGAGTARPNVIFQLGGDHQPDANYAKIDAVGTGIREVNPTVPIMVHAKPSTEGRVVYPNARWLNLNTVYTYYPGKASSRHVYAMSKDAYLRTPVMPYFMVESGYEGDGATPAQVRAQMYWPVLSGATGFGYGNRDIWPVSDSEHGRSGQPWQNHLNDRGAFSAGHAATVMIGRAWYDLVPDFDHTVVTAGYGTFNNTNNAGGNDYVTAGRTGNGRLVMAYLPSTGTGTRSLTVDMSNLTVNPVSAKWFNPANGTYTTIGSFANSGSRAFTTPGNNGQSMNDWLLILEAGATSTPTAATTTPPATTPPVTNPPATGNATLTARHSGKLAQVPAGSTDGAALTQNAATGAGNQQWELRDVGGGYVQLVNQATGKCADVTARSLLDGAAIVQWTCNTGTNQQWQLRDAGAGYVNLVARHSGKCADVLNRLLTDGAALAQWTCGTGTNQQWQRSTTTGPGPTTSPTASPTAPPPPPPPAGAKPRVIAMTDGEVDDRSSMVRFLEYASDYDVVGIVQTNSRFQRSGHSGDRWIEREIDLYAQVLPNLKVHKAGYPEASTLRNAIRIGNENSADLTRAPASMATKDTPGSDLIIRTLLDNDPRPVHIQAWGGANTLAYALYKLKTQYSAAEYNRAVSRAWIYCIWYQDGGGQWIEDNIPGAKIYEAYMWDDVWDYQSLTGPSPANVKTFMTAAWLNTNVKRNHGPLGAYTPQSYISEGDTPAFLPLINNGLNQHLDYTLGGWGGRPVFDQGNHMTDGRDDGNGNKPFWRWIPALQNDFAARMDWNVTSNFRDANHNPVARVNGALTRTAAPGSTVTLDASPTTDPDGNQLTFKWWQYYDADSVSARVAISNDTARTGASFVVPNERGRQIQVILEVTDNGTPALTHYQRIFVNIQ